MEWERKRECMIEIYSILSLSYVTFIEAYACSLPSARDRSNIFSEYRGRTTRSMIDSKTTKLISNCTKEESSVIGNCY